MQLQNLTVQQKQRCLIRDLNLQVEPGQCWVILGQNGAGKTSLLRTLVGLHHAQQGQVYWQNRAQSDWDLMQLARLRAYLPQGRNDAFSYSILEAVISALPANQSSAYWDSEADIDSAQAALQAFDVGHLAQRDVRGLSGGERQRVALAALLAQDADYLLLDEPLNALDVAHQIAVIRVLHQQRALNKAIIMVSHDLNLSYPLATHALLLLNEGGWLAGTAEAMFSAENLSACLGHPIQLVQVEGKTLFIPRDLV